ncbi:MAG: RsiV family protein [Eubacterium sp.]|nr:RsiV family protein [Eubacterium sp.]
MRRQFIGKKLLGIMISMALVLGSTGCSFGNTNDDDDNDDYGRIEMDGNQGDNDSTEEENDDQGSNNQDDSDGGSDKDIDESDSKVEQESDNKTTEEGQEESQDKDQSSEEKPASGPIICKREYSQIENIEGTYKPLYTRTNESLYLSSDTEAYYPGLKKALEDFNKATGNLLVGHAAEVENSFDEMVEMAKEVYDNTSDPEYFTELFDENYVDIERLDDQLLSIRLGFNNYYGGAHPYYGCTGYTYDANTGDSLKLVDMVSNLDDLREAAREVMSRDYPDLFNEEYNMELFNECFNDESSLAWTVEPEALVIYFNPYQIASFAEGQQVVRLKFSDYPDLFLKDYGKEDSDWVINSQQSMLDLNGDGSLEYIDVEFQQEYNEEYDYYSYTKFIITAGDVTIEKDYYDYDAETYIVRKDGKTYIYMDCQSDNDYHYIKGFELTGSEIKELEDVDGGFGPAESFYEVGDNYYNYSVPNFYNPDYFFIEDRMNLISTYQGTRPCKIGDDGSIVPITEAFVSNTDITLTSKMDLELEIVDEEGTLIERSTIPSGTEFSPYKTNNKDYVDLKMKDGRIARVNIDGSDWPHIIDGKGLEEVFDGTMFAG